MTDKGPRTAEGRALLDDVRIHNVAQRVKADDEHDEQWLRRVIAIEDAAYRQGIAAARAAVEGLPRIIDGKVVNEYDVLVRGKVLAALDSTDRP